MKRIPFLFLLLSLVSCGKKQPNPGAPHQQNAKITRATVGSHSVALSWTASSSTGIINYHIWREGTVVASTPSTTYVDLNLAPLTTFHYQVTAFYNPCTTMPSTPCSDSDPASVTVMTPADPVSIAVTVAPTTANVQVGKTQQFTATVTGTTNLGVNWTATAGTISATGLFTAPTTTGLVTVTASSVADTTKSASASVTVAALPQSGFNTGDRVKTMTTANVRGTAPPSGLGTLLGTVPAGSLGTVQPATQVPNTGGWIWVQVKFDTCSASIPNCTGYVGSDNLILVTPVPPPTPTLHWTCTPTLNTVTCVATTSGVPAGSAFSTNMAIGGLNATATGVSK